MTIGIWTPSSSELTKFQAGLGKDAGRFFSMTYQELYVRLLPLVSANDADDMTYLWDRYIAEPSR